MPVSSFDLIVVGSGPNGAAAVRQYRAERPEARVLMIEAGTEIGSRRGEHLIETPDDTVENSYLRLMRLARQLSYVEGSAPAGDSARQEWTTGDVGIAPAMYLGNDMRQFPGSAVSWNIGGMGVHWTAACPWPSGPEIPPDAPGGRWRGDLAQARRLLRVGSDGFHRNPFEAPIVAALRAALPAENAARAAQPMPMAGHVDADGRLHRTGPMDIFPALHDGTDPFFTLASGELCTRVLHGSGTATGVVVRELATGVEKEYGAAVVLIAADTLRTPQLLWASGIRPAALGVRLNEHATIEGGVAVDAARIGADGLAEPANAEGEPFLGAYWLPSESPRQPSHGQMMESVGDDGAHRLGMSWYVSTEIRPENRLEFSDTETDLTGMPRITAHFDYSDRDLETIEGARSVQRSAAEAIGDFDPDPSELMPSGASLHYTGTVRMGAIDDGTTVCDLTGAVWGFANLFVAGNGVVPTALTCNATLTGLALTVRTARGLTR